MDIVTFGETMVVFTPRRAGMLRYVGDFTTHIGGAESNVAIGLSRLGHQVGWMGKLGNDEFGYKIYQTLRGEGIDLSHVTFEDGFQTGIYFKEKINHEKLRVHYYRDNSAATTLAPSDLNEEYIASAKYLHITGITPLLSESCQQATDKAIEIAKENNVKIVFDPNIRTNLGSLENREALIELSKQADIILPGIEEGKFLTGKTSPEEIARVLYENGSSIVIVKLGEKGAYYYSEHREGYVSAYPVEQVVDPIGAGDGFASGVLSGFLDGLDLEESVRRGSVVGALVTMIQGDIEGLPDRSTLEMLVDDVNNDDVNR
ncbi:MAG TPA: sugar kinase [Virgibacillus sp.]|nr:sugar kinase [Virgibacillus sp.]